MVLLVCNESELVPFPAMLVVITTEEKKKLNSYAGFVLERAERKGKKKSEKERELVDGNPFFSQILPYFPLLFYGDYINTC